MAEVTTRRTGELLRKLFEILLANPYGLAARDALASLEKTVQLTDYEMGHYESGGRRFERIVRFATVDCVKAGWLLKDNGRWTLTDDGRDAFAALQDPEEFCRRATQLYQVWKAGQP